MRRSDTQKLGDVLKEYVDALKIRSKLKEVSIHRHWANLMGNGMMKYTSNIELKRGVLFVQLSSPVVRQELLLRSEKIRSALNQQIGDEIVKKIIFK
jgi:hypothetical protein